MSASDKRAVYLITPDASDRGGRSHTQIDRCPRFGIATRAREDRELGPAQARLRIGHHRRTYVVETINSTSGDVMKEIDRRLR
jgi:hypothetical protein